jgi:hypothetical protein
MHISILLFGFLQSCQEVEVNVRDSAYKELLILVHLSFRISLSVSDEHDINL